MTMINYSPIYISSGIWELWHDKGWDDYVHDTYKNEVKKLVDDETTKNVLLYGDNGMGKSMLMNLAMKEFLHKQKDVYVIDFRHLIKEYIKSWRGDSKIGKILMVDYLAIDDLGKEFSSGDISKELAITALDYVLRYRFQRKKSTWMTFNLKLKEIEVEYNGHIASLLKRSSVAICFEGDDYGDNMFKIIKPKTLNIDKKQATKGSFNE